MAAEDAQVSTLQDEAKVFMSIMGPGKDAMKAAFQAFYSSPNMYSNNGQMTLKEYTNNMNINTKKLKDIFGQGVIKSNILDVDIIQADKDITFYNAAITKLNVSAYDKLEIHSQEILKKMKDERNKLAHNADCLAQPLPDTLKYLEGLYTDLLDAFDHEFPGSPYLQDARVSVPSLNSRIRNEPMDLDQYQRDREKFNKDLQNWIVREGQRELAKNISFGNCTDPFQKLLDLRRISRQNVNAIEKVFTSPWIQHGQLKTPHESLLEVRDPQDQLPRVTFVAGQGGSGKSTLIHKIFTEWQNRGHFPPGLKRLEKFDFILYVELKHTCSNSLRELLARELLVETLMNTKWNDVFPILNDLNILFLVDGFDEVKEEGKKLVSEIARLLPNSRVLLSTRPEYLKEVQNIFQSSSSVTLILHGFDKNSQETFAKKVLELTEQDCDVASSMHVQFCEFLNRRGLVLKTHLELPLTMALLIFLWLEYRHSPEKLETINTATQLYRQLFLMLKEKLVRIRTLFAAVPGDAVESVLHHLQSAALEQLSLNVLLQLSQESYTAVKEKCSENDISDDDMQREFLSAFLVYDPDALVRPKKKAAILIQKPPFSFFHRTQMEYFGAEHAVRELVRKNITCLNECLSLSNKRRYKEVIPFIVGCLSNENVLELHCEELISLSLKADVDDTDFNFWFNLISETARRDQTFGDTSFSEELCSKIVDKLPDRSWELKTETLISGLSLLIHCKTVQLTTLEIDCRINDDPNDVTDLDDILQQAKDVLGKKFSRRKIALSLHIRAHRMNYNENQTDHFLEYFLPWAQIVKFTGHLGPRSVRHLAACKHIDIKLSSLDGFNVFMNEWTLFRKCVKKLTITPNFVGSFDENLVCPIPSRWSSCDFLILFYGVSHESLERVITFVKRCTSRGSSFVRLGVYTSSLGYTDGVRLFASLQNLVTEKVTVQSSVHLRGEQGENIMREALAGNDRTSTFQAEWNNSPLGR